LNKFPGVDTFLEHPPESVLEEICQSSSEALGGPVCVSLLDHLDLVNFYVTHVCPESPGLSRRLPLEVEGGNLLRVVHDHEVVYAPAREWSFIPLDTPHLSAAPVAIRENAIGSMFLGGDEAPSEATLEDLRRLGVRAGVALGVADQYTDTVETRRCRGTPSIAAELQSDQLPPRALYTRDVQLVGGIEPVYDVGGDWFDYSLDPGRLFVAVCDGVGRGLSAASISYVTLGAVRNARKRGCNLEEIAELAHESLISSTNYEQFATLILASIDLRTLQIDLLSAAHPAPVMLPPPGVGTPQTLEPTYSYPPLGAFKKGQKYVSRRWDLTPGSRLVFFSDGATERRDAHGRQLGVEGLLEYLEQYRSVVKLDLLRSLMREIKGFGDAGIQDDVTIVGVDLPPFD